VLGLVLGEQPQKAIAEALELRLTDAADPGSSSRLRGR
jgi:hypothetical protein